VSRPGVKVTGAPFVALPGWFFAEKKLRFQLGSREWVGGAHLSILVSAAPRDFGEVGPDTIGALVEDIRGTSRIVPGVPFFDVVTGGKRASHYLVPLGSCAVLVPYLAAVETFYPGYSWYETKAGRFFVARVGAVPVAAIGGNIADRWAP